MAGSRGTKRDDRSTRGRKADAEKPLEDEHAPVMDAKIVDEAIGVIENGLVGACARAAQEGNIPGLIALHKHFARIKRGAGGRTRGPVPAREELERIDHAFARCEADAAS